MQKVFSDLSDEELLKLTARSNTSAFEVLVRRHQHTVLKLAVRFLHDDVEAEDITQEVFLKIFRFAASFKGGSSAKTWMYRIITHCCLDVLKQRKGRKTVEFVPDTVSTEQFNPSEQVEKQETQVLVAKAIERLPSEQKMVLVLQRFEGLRYREIAEVMGINRTTVGQLLQKALENLKAVLSEYIVHDL